MEKTRIPGVYSRGSRYVAVYRDPDGIQRKKAFRTQGEAAAFKKSQEVSIDQGTYQAPSQITLHEYLAEWLPAYDQIRENTRDDYELGARTAREFFSSREKLTAVTPRRIAEYVSHLSDTSMAPRTVHKRLVPLRSMFRTAMEQGLIRTNPCQGVRLPKVQAQIHDEDHEDDTVKVFTTEQLDCILSIVKQPALFELLACTGLRISEALALEWRHLELNGSSPHVKVRRAIVRGFVGPPKSTHGRRDVALPHALILKLRKAQNEAAISPSLRQAPRGSTEALVEPEAAQGSEDRSETSGLPRQRNDGADTTANGGPCSLRGLVFPSSVGSPVAEATLPTGLVFASTANTPLAPNNLRRRILQPALDEAGCAWAGFHTFRHTYASMQLSRGTNIVALSRALGHHSPAFTLNTYAHLMQGDEAPALELQRIPSNLASAEKVLHGGLVSVSNDSL